MPSLLSSNDIFLGTLHHCSDSDSVHYSLRAINQFSVPPHSPPRPFNDQTRDVTITARGPNIAHNIYHSNVKRSANEPARSWRLEWRVKSYLVHSQVRIRLSICTSTKCIPTCMHPEYTVGLMYRGKLQGWQFSALAWYATKGYMFWRNYTHWGGSDKPTSCCDYDFDWNGREMIGPDDVPETVIQLFHSSKRSGS